MFSYSSFVNNCVLFYSFLCVFVDSIVFYQKSSIHLFSSPARLHRSEGKKKERRRQIFFKNFFEGKGNYSVSPVCVCAPSATEAIGIWACRPDDGPQISFRYVDSYFSGLLFSVLKRQNRVDWVELGWGWEKSMGGGGGGGAGNKTRATSFER